MGVLLRLEVAGSAPIEQWKRVDLGASKATDLASSLGTFSMTGLPHAIGRFVATWIASCAVATTAQAQGPVDAVAFLQAEQSSAVGQGVFLKTARGCLLITAAHVVADTETVTWRFRGQSGRAIVKQAFSQNGLDIAFLEPVGTAPATCPDAPPRALTPVVQASDGLLTYVSPAGEPSPVPLVQTGYAPFLAFSPVATGQSIQAGFSGAAVRSGGALIGIATDVKADATPPRLLVQRFDELPPAAAAWLGTAAGPTWDRFDVRQLPKDVQNVALAARAVRPQADAAYKAALAIALRADEAAEEGRRLGPKGERFATSSVPGGEFAGAIVRNADGRAVPQGLGVLTITRGEHAGRRIECNFKDATRCEGEGRLKDPDGSRWMGPMCGIDACGHGYFQYPTGGIWVGSLTQPGRRSVTALENIKEGVPEKISEGQYEAGFDGPMVTWDNATGRLLAISDWKANSRVGERPLTASAPQDAVSLAGETAVRDGFADGLVFPTARDGSCDLRGKVNASGGPSLPVNVRNRSGRKLKIYWIGSDGLENFGQDLLDKPASFLSGSDVPYLVTDEDGQCIRIFRATERHSYFTFGAGR